MSTPRYQVKMVNGQSEIVVVDSPDIRSALQGLVDYCENLPEFEIKGEVDAFVALETARAALRGEPIYTVPATEHNLKLAGLA